MVGDHRIAQAHGRPISEVAGLLGIGGLKRAGREMVGPCPMCGGRDRFSINGQKQLFNCRKCGAAGDQIGLVAFVRGIGFREALDWLCGPESVLSDDEREAREALAREHAKAREAEAEAYRRRAINEARAIWQRGQSAEGTPVRDYLVRRGIPADRFPIPACLRFDPDRPYMTSGADGTGWRALYRGPAMLAAIQGPDGRFCGVHQTWLDLAQPKGKLVLPHPDKPGEFMPAKKVHGAKKGGAIRLRPVPLPGGPQRLVMAEGIETTLSALVADDGGAAFWAGVDLGNMAGQRMLGKGRKYAGIPDMTDADAFVPPPWVRELVFVMDGDSEPRLTRAKLLSGCRRAMAIRPGLRAWIVPVPAGMDLNDVLMGAGEDK